MPNFTGKKGMMIRKGTQGVDVVTVTKTAPAGVTRGTVDPDHNARQRGVVTRLDTKRP